MLTCSMIHVVNGVQIYLLRSAGPGSLVVSEVDVALASAR